MTSAPAVGVSGLLGRPYKTIRLEWSSDLHLLRVRTCVRPIQCYSLSAMGELQQMLGDISANPGLVRHFVMSSDVPRVFNFGGDLALFVLLVRAGDVESLKLYGKRCVDRSSPASLRRPPTRPPTGSWTRCWRSSPSRSCCARVTRRSSRRSTRA